MSLGPNTKSALSRIVGALPFLKADGNGIPIAQRGFIEEIRRGALTSSEGLRDVQIISAEAWATAELEKAIAADSSPAPEPTKEVSIIGGGVVVHEQPLGNLSDAELEALTAPEKEDK